MSGRSNEPSQKSSSGTPIRSTSCLSCGRIGCFDLLILKRASASHPSGQCYDVGDGELHRIARTIIKDNHLFDAPNLGGVEEAPQPRRLARGGKYR